MTGGSGFIGSHIVDYLISRGNQVVVLDDYSTGRKSNLEHHKHNPGLTVIEGSILDKRVVSEAAGSVDRIFHLAAAVGVFNIVQQPLKSLRTNIMGSENVFEVALESMKPVLITSSSEIYGKNSARALSEDDDRVIGPPQKIRWSYSDSKAIDESIAINMHLEAGLETRIVRLFNTVGPRQIGNYGMVLPRFVESAMNNLPIEIFGSGQQTRCFSHVEDIVEAIILIDSVPAAIGKPINIGVEDEISIAELAKLVKITLGSKSEIVHREYDEVYNTGFEDMTRRVPNIERLISLTGWKPKKKIEDMIYDISINLLDSSR